jgi:E3 ubiquitin-protein ligase RNF144
MPTMPLDGLCTKGAGEVEANTDAKKTLSSDAVPSKNTLTLRCNPEAHTYCRSCLIDLFTSTINNTALFLPRCCKLPIPLDTCRALLPKALIKKFDLKVGELATPNTIYCFNAECSEFIRPIDIKADGATCSFCAQKTCVFCKCKKHPGLCPSDPHVQLLMDTAKRSRWQQCTKCKNMVELSSGCFHMTYVFIISYHTNQFLY